VASPDKTPHAEEAAQSLSTLTDLTERMRDLQYRAGQVDYAVTSSRLLCLVAVVNPVWARRIASKRLLPEARVG